MAVHVCKCRIPGQVPGLGYIRISDCVWLKPDDNILKICSYIYSIYYTLLPTCSCPRINSQSHAYILSVNATSHINHHVSDLQIWTNNFGRHCVIVSIIPLEKTQTQLQIRNLHLTFTNTLRLTDRP